MNSLQIPDSSPSRVSRPVFVSAQSPSQPHQSQSQSHAQSQSQSRRQQRASHTPVPGRRCCPCKQPSIPQCLLTPCCRNLRDRPPMLHDPQTWPSPAPANARRGGVWKGQAGSALSVGRGGGHQDYPQGKHRSVAQDVQSRAGDRGPEGASSLSFPSVPVTLTLTMMAAAHRPLKLPNIVRLYDVIEMDKYIGIISGGELFDHILAHCHLKEKDAAKLFSQLVSGVWYIHQMKIVHRNLKLENLLLDRHRNVIITNSNIVLTISCRPAVDRRAMLLLSSLFQKGSMSALQLTYVPAASFCTLCWRGISPSMTTLPIRTETTSICCINILSTHLYPSLTTFPPKPEIVCR